MKKRIAVDMDEVIADALGKRLRLYNEEFAKTLRRHDFEGKGFYEGIQKEHVAQARQHIHSVGFFADLEVIEGSQEALRELGERHDIFIATAAMEVPVSFTEKYNWLRQHFPFLDPQNFIFCGRKSVVAADYLIDDTPRQLELFSGQGLLFSHPKNIDCQDYPRFDTWAEVVAYFNDLE